MKHFDDLMALTRDDRNPLFKQIEQLTDLRIACYRSSHTPGTWVITLESSENCQRLDIPRHRKVRTSRFIHEDDIKCARDAVDLVELNIQMCVKDMIEHLVLQSHKLLDITEARERRRRWLKNFYRLPFQYYDERKNTWITRRPCHFLRGFWGSK